MKQRSGQSTPWLDRIGRHIDLIVPVILSLVAAAAIVVSRGFPKTAVSTDIGAGYFPSLYSCVLIVLCTLLATSHLLSRPQREADATAQSATADHEFKDSPQYFKTAIAIVATFISLFLMPVAGFTLVSLAYMSGAMWLFGFRHRLWNPLIAVMVTVALYGTFAWGLQVPLPVGVFFE